MRNKLVNIYRNKTKLNCIIVLLLVNIVLVLYSTPVVDIGDTTAYISMAKAFACGNTGVLPPSRSPLLSLIISPLFSLFQDNLAFGLVVIFNYILLFSTSILVMYFFRQLFSNMLLPFIIALSFNLSLSTIGYANIVLTEILTVFLLTTSLYLLVLYRNKGKILFVIVCGITVALTGLARFNTIPIIVTFIIAILYTSICIKKETRKRIAIVSFAFILPYLLIINSWAYFQYTNNRGYGLFPSSTSARGFVAPNAQVAIIDEDIIVSPELQPILDIYLSAKVEINESMNSSRSASLSRFDFLNILGLLHGNYPARRLAERRLENYFDQNSIGDQDRTNLHNLYIEEVIAQRQIKILQIRVLSFVSGFRASYAGVLPTEYGNINLNILPIALVKAYKLLIMFASVFVFFSFFYYIFQAIKKREINYFVTLCYLIIFSFWGINFVFITTNDANRFKYPAEPWIIGIFIYYLNRGYIKSRDSWHKRK